MEPGPHRFDAVAFEEDLTPRDLVSLVPGARASLHELHARLEPHGDVWAYAFGAVVFHDVSADRRALLLAGLKERVPALTAKVVHEEFLVSEAPGGERTGVRDGVLAVDRLTEGRAGVVALTVAQSAAMEAYEQQVEAIFARTNEEVARLERRGTVPMLIRPLHRFIGEAIATRNEVLSVLHLLDKPDETWTDPAMDRIYGDLRAEFDLADRYAALESKLRAVQESLELILDVARDRRLVLLELAIVLLIVLEVVLGLLKKP